VTEENGQLRLSEKSPRHVEFPTEDFDWMTDKDVIVAHSPGIAVYRNNEGSVVIRQYGMAAEDVFVVVRREDVKRVVKAIAALANGQT
jgi:transcription initiation factor TFIIIB Brf1 subunit/transcription initiation factor TFIIB